MSHRSGPCSVSISAIVVALSLLCACEPRSPSAPGSAADEELDPTSQTIFGERLLLFLEHPHLVRGEGASFLAHLSIRASGEPVHAGSVTLEIGGTRLSAESPKRAGLFVPVGSLTEAGRHAARLIVQSGEHSETLALEPMVVHATLESARQAAAARAEPAAAVPFLMEQQWKLRLLLAEAAPRTLVERLIVSARVATAEGAQAVVAPSLAGRLLAPPGGRMPRTGERVEAGQVLALVEPPLGASELAQLQALQLEFDLKALEVVRVASAAEAELRFAESERARLRKLREQGLSTQQELEQAERDLLQAQAADQAARATRQALDALRAGRATALLPLRLPLTAPLAGLVVCAGLVEGEWIGPGQELCRILDPAQLWIEGRVSEFDLARLGDAPPALVTFPALPGTEFQLGAPLHLAPELAGGSRTLLVRYAVENPTGELRAGMLAELALATARSDSALAIPREAVIREQGIPTVYVMLEGELFQRRELELGLEDGAFVEVRSGLAPGEHVATRGAHIVKLAALSPAAFGAGHAH